MLGVHSFFTKANISSDMRTIVEKYMGPGGFTKEAKGNETGIVWEKGATAIRLLSGNTPDQDGEYALNLAFSTPVQFWRGHFKA